MIINLKIPDDLYDKYLSQYGSPKHYGRMKEAIEFFSQVPSNDRVVVIYGKDRQEVEALLQTTIDDGAKLAKLIRNMCSFRIGGVEVTFTDDQLARLDMQAKFHGRTRETYLREMVEEIKSKFLEEI